MKNNNEVILNKSNIISKHYSIRCYDQVYEEIELITVSKKQLIELNKQIEKILKIKGK